jgi:hypothetical protein
MPLITDGKPVGALSLYARAAGVFGAGETRRAERLAENASGALSLALRLASCAALTDQRDHGSRSRRAGTFVVTVPVCTGPPLPVPIRPPAGWSLPIRTLLITWPPCPAWATARDEPGSNEGGT